MQRMKMVFAVAAIMLVASTQAMAAGDCDRSVWGHGEEWQSYDGVDEEVQVRTCVSKYNSAHIDVKNDHPYDICVTVANSNGQRWSKWPVEAYKVLSHQTKGGHEVTWQVGAFKKQGSYCK